MGIPWASHHEGDHLGGIDSGKGRENRPGDARAQLRLAHDQFASIGMEAFAERARRGLAASGEAVRKLTVETRDELTAQERQVALFARDGCPALSEPAHRRLPPLQGVLQAGDQLTPGAGRRAPEVRVRACPGLALPTSAFVTRRDSFCQR